MRVSDGARKINGHGGAIFVHEDRLEERAIDIPIFTDLPQSPITSIEIRDFVYGRLIKLSPAERYRSPLISGGKGLLARGLSEYHFGNYGGLPASSRERDRLALQLLRETRCQFPSADSMRGVPGFWEDCGSAHLWKPRDYLVPRLIIPVRDERGRIQACQMRLPLAAKKGSRYLWLSSSNLRHGCGSGSPLHFKFRPADLPLDAQIVIVEGVLKADVLFALRPELFIIATPCVTANHEQLVKLTHTHNLVIAFDQDFVTNESVCFHLASLIARRINREKTLATTRIGSWDARYKGVDDAALHNIPIASISIRRWLDRLSPRFRQIAMKRIADLGAFPLKTNM
jgi:hypothetical protein